MGTQRVPTERYDMPAYVLPFTSTLSSPEYSIGIRDRVSVLNIVPKLAVNGSLSNHGADSRGKSLANGNLHDVAEAPVRLSLEISEPKLMVGSIRVIEPWTLMRSLVRNGDSNDFSHLPEVSGA